MEFNWFIISLLVGMAQGLFLILNLVLFPKRLTRQSNLVLCALLVTLVLSLMLRLGYDNFVFYHYPRLSIAGDFVMLIIGPLLYYYTRSLLFAKKVLRSRELWHLVPVVLFFLSFIYLFKYDQEQIIHLQLSGGLRYYYEAIMWSAAILIVFYSIAARKEVLAYNKIHFQKEASLPKTALLMSVLTIVFCSVSIWVVSMLVMTVIPELGVYANYIYQILFLFIVLLVFIISFHAINSPEILTHVAPAVKYRQSSLSSTELIDIKTRLEYYFDTKKPYLESELTLTYVANEIQTNQAYLSRVINESYGKNFFDFVNEYRVRTFIEKVLSGNYDHLTYAGVSLECGFGTKATFFRAFKKITSRTPREYFKELGASREVHPENSVENSDENSVENPISSRVEDSQR